MSFDVATLARSAPEETRWAELSGASLPKLRVPGSNSRKGGMLCVYLYNKRFSNDPEKEIPSYFKLNTRAEIYSLEIGRRLISYLAKISHAQMTAAWQQDAEMLPAIDLAYIGQTTLGDRRLELDYQLLSIGLGDQSKSSEILQDKIECLILGQEFFSFNVRH
nr:hypothetical protein BgiMline_032210 [Biomphalaria glabrata]